MKKKIAFTSTVVMAIVLIAVVFWGRPDENSRELGVDLSGGRILSEYDTHGGFHGDGTSCTVYEFEEGKEESRIEEILAADARWNPFPLNETVTALVYGISDETESFGPFLTDEEGKTLVPEIQNGYYYLKDRMAENGKATGASLLYRSSYNFTLAIYDADRNRLYVCKMDT